jgi:hypothetical protein
MPGKEFLYFLNFDFPKQLNSPHQPQLPVIKTGNFFAHALPFQISFD